MTNLKEKVIEVLKSSGLVSEADLKKAMDITARSGKMRLKDLLVGMGVVEEKELISILSGELNIPFLNLAHFKIESRMASIIPEKMARKYGVVAVSTIGKQLVVAMSDPFNALTLDETKALTNYKIDFVISTEEDIREALDRLYKPVLDGVDALPGGKSEPAAVEEIRVMRSDEDAASAVALNEDGSGDAPVVRMVDLILKEALHKRASDIHIEPFEKKVRVRYRIDGALHEVLSLPKKNKNAMLTRIKIMSKLDITENRIPQDGRFKVQFGNKEVDFRLSILPVNFGSKIVMRILDKSSLTLGLEKLGFYPETLETFNSAIAQPFGMILITGPTGSGKTTTLYSVLNKLNSPDRNIITVEDPIEYQVRGITQIQVRPDIGLDFAGGLRAILRQSPDIVMVGEIRDAETADIAIKASLTGQLVLSTLHTNDAAGAITRLMDMGTEPFLIASSVVMVGAQRLCRKICSACKQKVEIPEEVYSGLGARLEQILSGKGKPQFFQGRGCEKCNKTGYYGRVSILEALVIDDTVRDMIMQRSSSHKIKEYAMQHGMFTLREDALRKCMEGITTLDEVIRITSGDE